MKSTDCSFSPKKVLNCFKNIGSYKVLSFMLKIPLLKPIFKYFKYQRFQRALGNFSLRLKDLIRSSIR